MDRRVFTARHTDANLAGESLTVTTTKTEMPRFTLPPLRLFDGALWLVLLLCLFALRPLVVNPGLPNGPDVLYHTYRTAEMARSWEHGVFLPRWAEGMYYGYGSPVFHYYASLTYYLGAALMQILNLPALDALRVLIIASVFFSGAGMYWFMKQQVGRLAGVLAAIAYVYTPYLLFTEPYGRGAYPELLAFALFPHVMLAYGRLLRTTSGRDMALVTLIHGALIITHNLMALALTAVIVLWLLWQWGHSIIQHFSNRLSAISPQPAASQPQTASNLEADPPAKKSLFSSFVFFVSFVVKSGFANRYGRAFAAMVLAVGITAYFWLPVLLETEAVNLANLTAVAELDYQNAFVPIEGLLSLPPIMDNGAINGLPHVLSLGVAHWLLAVVAIAALVIFIFELLTRTGKHDGRIVSAGVFFTLLTLLMIFLITPASGNIWASLRGLQYMQFPWRFLGVAAFSIAFLVGLNALWLEKLSARYQIGLVTLFVAAPIVLAFPMLNVPEWYNRQVDDSIGGYLQAELDKKQSGTTYTNEYRPRTVYSPPAANLDLIADYRDGYPINKANAPENVTVELLGNNPEYHEWRMTSETEFTLEVLNYYWWGWTAEINGQRTNIVPSYQHGLITLTVPAGTHSIKLYLGQTPARLLGNTLSAIMAILVLATIALIHPVMNLPRPTIAPLSAAQRRGIVYAGLATVLLGFIGLREGVLWRNTPPGDSPAQNVARFMLDDSFQLLGYDINNTAFFAGETLHLTLYWFPAKPADVNYSSFVHVAKPDTPPLAQADKLHPGGRAIREWWYPTGYIEDEYQILLPPDMPSGEYTIFVGFYTCEGLPEGQCGNGIRPVATNAAGTEVGDSIPLTTMTIR